MLFVVWSPLVCLGQQPGAISQETVISKDTFGVDLMFSPIHIMRKNNRDSVRFLDLLTRATGYMADADVGVLGFDVLWEEIEASVGKGYSWSELDRVMRILHDKGLKAKVTFYPTHREANGGSRKPVGHRNWRGTVKTDHFDRLCTAIRNLVERYDGDGQADAFKMGYPVLWFFALSGEVESWKHWAYYGGTPEEYDRLLNLTSSCVSKGHKSLLVGRGATNFGSFFETVDLNDRRQQYDRSHERFRRFLVSSLENKDDYDMFGLQYNYSWRAMVPQIDYVAVLFDRFGYEKPIYVNHARSTEVGFAEELKILRDSSHAKYNGVRKRYHAMQAETTIKKAVVALGCGVKYVGVACLLDYPRLLMHQKIGEKGHEGAQWALTGLFECSWDGKESGFFAKPAYYSYRLFIQKMLGVVSEVKRVNVADSVWAFAFKKQGRWIFVLWVDERMEGGEKEKEIELSVNSRKVKITEMITDRGKAKPETSDVEAKKGKVHIKANATPLFVEELY